MTVGRLRRIATFSVTATVAYWLAVGLVTFLIPADGATRPAYLLAMLAGSAAVAYFLVYAGGYDRLRDRVG